MTKLLLVLTLWVLASELSQGSEGRNPTYGVKLCGREFIRAVIFTCGGSRWRRAARASTGDLPDSFNSERAPEDEGSESWNPDTVPGLSYKDYPDYESQNWREQLAGLGFSRQSRSAISEEVLEALRTSDRKGRDVVIGLSNACCKWGCSKSEISSLC
ncbi:REL3 protein, partial [Polyodon spathula]|nr:relaxin-3b [Polyodon spathula]MBN3286537.1 REL3 protein [Polyodon spathula]